VERIADDLILIGRGRIVAQGSKQELLQGAGGAYVRAVEQDQLAAALTSEGLQVVSTGEGLRSDAEAVRIGAVAAAHRITLIELRPADGAGLEDLFLQLTADTQRDDLTEGALA
jgi:ABC-2 type transport system ATP-binding protein